MPTLTLSKRREPSLIQERGKTSLLARQPVYNREFDIQGYQLRFESDCRRSPNRRISDSSASQIILSAFAESSLDDLLAGKPGYVNFTRALILEPPLRKSQKLVVEINEDIEIDDKLVEAVGQLKSNGLTIARDGYCLESTNDKLLEMTDILKFDMQSISISHVKNKLIKLQGKPVTLLAEKIEDHNTFKELKELGFSLFQGDFLAKPHIIDGRRIDADQKTILRLQSVLQDNGAEFSDIETVISSSSVLSYKLLRLINSAAFGLNRPVESLQQALTLLGLDTIRSWGSLLALASVKTKPDSLCLNALIRAEMCKRLAEKVGLDLRGKSLFTAGLISTMDAFLDMPLTDIVNSINLPPWMRATLLNQEGIAGLLLKTAIAYEKADFDGVNWKQLYELGLNPEEVQSAYHDSIVWAADVIDNISLD